MHPYDGQCVKLKWQFSAKEYSHKPLRRFDKDSFFTIDLPKTKVGIRYTYCCLNASQQQACLFLYLNSINMMYGIQRKIRCIYIYKILKNEAISRLTPDIYGAYWYSIFICLFQISNKCSFVKCAHERENLQLSNYLTHAITVLHVRV